MSSSVIQQFDFKPVSIDSKQNADYTVPAGMYAKVIVSYTCNAFVGSSDAVNGAFPPANTSNGNVEYWLTEADVISSVRLNANNTNSGAGFVTDYSEIDIKVNGNVVKNLRNHISGYAASDSIIFDGFQVQGLSLAEFPKVLVYTRKINQRGGIFSTVYA